MNQGQVLPKAINKQTLLEMHTFITDSHNFIFNIKTPSGGNIVTLLVILSLLSLSTNTSFPK